MDPTFTSTLQIKPGEYVFKEGDPNNGFFILLAGTIGVEKQGRQLGEISDPSTIFGEVGPILGKDRTCSLVARTEVNVLHVGMTVDELFEKRPLGWEAFVKSLVYALAERLDSASDRYVNRPTLPPWGVQ